VNFVNDCLLKGQAAALLKGQAAAKQQLHISLLMMNVSYLMTILKKY
jgi:hypothetical protein